MLSLSAWADTDAVEQLANDGGDNDEKEKEEEGEDEDDGDEDDRDVPVKSLCDRSTSVVIVGDLRLLEARSSSSCASNVRLMTS